MEKLAKGRVRQRGARTDGQGKAADFGGGFHGERQGRICRELQPSPSLSAHACRLTELQIRHQEESRVGSGLGCLADAGGGGAGQEKPSGPPGTSPVFLGPVTG